MQNNTVSRKGLTRSSCRDAVAVAEHADECHVVIDESLQVKVLARMLHTGYMRVRATRTNIIRFGQPWHSATVKTFPARARCTTDRTRVIFRRCEDPSSWVCWCQYRRYAQQVEVLCEVPWMVAEIGLRVRRRRECIGNWGRQLSEESSNRRRRAAPTLHNAIDGTGW